MGLIFGANSTDNVNHGSAANLDNLTTMTIIMWVYPTTLTSSRGLFDKSTGAGGASKLLRLAFGVADELNFAQVNATPAIREAITNNVNLTTDKWWYIAATLNIGSSPEMKIYFGDLATPVVEATYTTQSDATNVRDDSGGNALVGNRASLTAPFQGNIAFGGTWNRTFTLAEIIQQQFRSFVSAGNVINTLYGYEAGVGTQPDRSGAGNSGTITGATQGFHVPLGLPYEI